MVLGSFPPQTITQTSLKSHVGALRAPTNSWQNTLRGEAPGHRPPRETRRTGGLRPPRTPRLPLGASHGVATRRTWKQRCLFPWRHLGQHTCQLASKRASWLSDRWPVTNQGASIPGPGACTPLLVSLLIREQEVRNSSVLWEKGPSLRSRAFRVPAARCLQQIEQRRRLAPCTRGSEGRATAPTSDR